MLRARRRRSDPLRSPSATTYRSFTLASDPGVENKPDKAGGRRMVKVRFEALVLAVLVTWTAAAHPRQSSDQAVRLGINLVTLDVAVNDKHRRAVRNLTAKDFTVIEDGVEQRIEHFSAGDSIDGRVKPKGQAGAGAAGASA